MECFVKSIIILLCFLPFILFANQITDPYKDIEYLTLKNGLQVYLLPNKKSTNTSIIVEVGVGTDIENKSTAGISHLVEHLVFRDKRVPHRDYYDYLTDQGAFNVNGLTGSKTTEYIATIDASKSYFLVETFYKMLFNKQVDNTDLNIERKALQTEIGDSDIASTLGFYFGKIDKLFPPVYDFYKDHFSIQPKEQIPLYYEQSNNKKYTLNDVLQHYDNYYYPKNMILKLVGNFDSTEIKTLIDSTFGLITKEGTFTTKNDTQQPIMNNKPFFKYQIGENDKNYAYIGVKYIDTSFKQYIILESYLEFLSKQIQRDLRNKQGKTYTVNDFHSTNGTATIKGIGFDALHGELENNFNYIKSQIFNHVDNLTDLNINKALNDFKINYFNYENDINSLFNLISDVQLQHEIEKEYSLNPYEVFNSITNEEYKEVITSIITKNNSYTFINKSHYLFPFDILIISLSFLALIIALFISYSFFLLKRSGEYYTARDILFTRRVTNRFITFIVFMITLYISAIFYLWLEYFISIYIFNNEIYFKTLIGSEIFLYELIATIVSVVIFFTFFSLLFKNYIIKIDVIENKLYIVGSRLITLNKEDILEIKEVKWNILNFFKTLGYSFLFFKNVVMIRTIDNKVYYIKSSKAQHLVDDLNNWCLKE